MIGLNGIERLLDCVDSEQEIGFLNILRTYNYRFVREYFLCIVPPTDPNILALYHSVQTRVALLLGRRNPAYFEYVCGHRGSDITLESFCLLCCRIS